MATTFGFLVAALIVGSLLAVAGFALAAGVATLAAARASRADRVLRADLDRVLADVLGPRDVVGTGPR